MLFWQRRLLKETAQLRAEYDQGLPDSQHMRIVEDLHPINERGFCAALRIHIAGAPATIYAGEIYTLEFRFPSNYPFSSPAVTFVPPDIPMHPHVYSNGHICLSILCDDWTPALTVSTVCESIVSMLSSCKTKQRPPDDMIYTMRASTNPKETKWWLHDDKV